jgi:hypothetical protein
MSKTSEEFGPFSLALGMRQNKSDDFSIFVTFICGGAEY